MLETYFSGRGAPELPDEVVVYTRSYMLEDRQYVAPLVFFDERDEDVWVTQACSAPLAIDGGRVAEPARKSDGYKPLQELLAGTAVGDFRRLMEEAQVKKEVRPYLDLRPAERSRRVYGR